MSGLQLLHPRNRWSWISLCGISAGVAIPLSSPSDGAHHRTVRPQQDGVVPVATVEAAKAPSELPRRRIATGGGDLFAPRSWTRPPPLRLEPEGPLRPVAPPLPYRFAGTIRYDGTLKVVLAAGDRIYEAKVGEVMDGVYRVQAVTHDTVSIVYTPLGIEQQLAYAPGASAQAGLPESDLHSPPRQVIVEQPAPSATYQGQRALSRFPPGSPLATR